MPRPCTETSPCDTRSQCPEIWFRDMDGDGYGAGPLCVTAEERGESFLLRDITVQNLGDCDDANPEIHPGVLDSPGDGVDSDCDTVAD